MIFFVHVDCWSNLGSLTKKLTVGIPPCAGNAAASAAEAVTSAGNAATSAGEAGISAQWKCC